MDLSKFGKRFVRFVTELEKVSNYWKWFWSWWKLSGAVFGFSSGKRIVEGLDQCPGEDKVKHETAQQVHLSFLALFSENEREVRTL